MPATAQPGVQVLNSNTTNSATQAHSKRLLVKQTKNSTIHVHTKLAPPPLHPYYMRLSQHDVIFPGYIMYINANNDCSQVLKHYNIISIPYM